MVDSVPDKARKGRGAVSNRTGRFEPETRLAVDDGWGIADVLAEEKPLTTVTDERPKKIINRNSSPDIPFDRSINPYRGCEHGCIYCFARPTHAYHGLSPGLDFETKLFAKPNAAVLLDAELRKPGYRVATLQLGANTDPYQPIERMRRITRSVLEVLSSFNHPVGITTKSDLVTRDIDILAPMAEKSLAAVAVSITTLDRKLARVMEPRCPTPAKRLDAVRALSDADIPVMVMTAPLIPSLNDHEVESILAEARAAGAVSAGYVLLRLPLEIHQLFEEWLEEHVPNRAARVMKLVRQTRGGKAYDSTFGERMRGTGTYAEMMRARYDLARRKAGFTDEMAAGFRRRTDLFRAPLGSALQPSLFDDTPDA